MSQSEPIVAVKNLTKSFGKNKVLDNVSFNIYQNELLLIVGFSGSGKSTLLRIISGLEEADAGEVILKTPNLGMVFQGAALFDSMTVFDNVAFPLINQKKNLSYQEIKHKVTEKLKMVGLADIENLRPDELSGGMKKRVSLARALINDPEIILYDEPTSGLDPVVSNIVIEYILKLKNELNSTSVLVTHNLSTIGYVTGRLLLLYDAKFVWEGQTKEFLTTDNPFAKQFREGRKEGPMLVIRE